MRSWINAKIELPKKDYRVLVRAPKVKNMINICLVAKLVDFLLVDAWCPDDLFTNEYGISGVFMISKDSVSHWMEIPEFLE